MFLEAAFDSDTKVKLIRVLAAPPFPSLDAGALAKECGKSRAWIHRSLPELLATRLVVGTKRGRTTLYAINSQHPLFDAILTLFRQESQRQNVQHLVPTFWNHLERPIATLASDPNVQFIVLFGSLMRPPIFPSSDIDLLVGVTTKGPIAVTEPILGHVLSLVVMTTSAFDEKVRANDPFITSALERAVVLYQADEYSFPWPDRPGSTSWQGWGKPTGWTHG